MDARSHIALRNAFREQVPGSASWSRRMRLEAEWVVELECIAAVDTDVLPNKSPATPAPHHAQPLQPPPGPTPHRRRQPRRPHSHLASEELWIRFLRDVRTRLARVRSETVERRGTSAARRDATAKGDGTVRSSAAPSAISSCRPPHWPSQVLLSVSARDGRSRELLVGWAFVEPLQAPHAGRAEHDRSRRKVDGGGDPESAADPNSGRDHSGEGESERLAQQRAEPVVCADARERGRRDVLLQRRLPERIEEHVPEAGNERCANENLPGQLQRKHDHRERIWNYD